MIEFCVAWLHFVWSDICRYNRPWGKHKTCEVCICLSFQLLLGRFCVTRICCNNFTQYTCTIREAWLHYIVNSARLPQHTEDGFHRQVPTHLFLLISVLLWTVWCIERYRVYSVHDNCSAVRVSISFDVWTYIGYF